MIEIPPELHSVSYLAGEKWPQGNETLMFAMGMDWKDAAQQMSQLTPALEQIQSQSASASSDATSAAIAEFMDSLLSGDSSIANLADSMTALGASATSTGAQIQYTKLQILVMLGIAAADIAYALACADWTFGASLAWIPVIEGATIAVVRELAAQLVRRIVAELAETATRTGIKKLVKDVAVRGIQAAAFGTAIGVASDIVIQEYQVAEGVREGIDWAQTVQTAIGGVVGGLAGGAAHGVISHLLGGPATSIGGKITEGVIGNFGEGVVGSVAGAKATGGSIDGADIFGAGGAGAGAGAVHGAGEHGGGHTGDGPGATGDDPPLKVIDPPFGDGPGATGDDPPLKVIDPPFGAGDDPSDLSSQSWHFDDGDDSSTATSVTPADVGDLPTAVSGGAPESDTGSKRAAANSAAPGAPRGEASAISAADSPTQTTASAAGPCLSGVLLVAGRRW